MTMSTRPVRLASAIVALLAAAGAVVLLPASVMAQVCLGSPARAGEFTVQGGVAFQDGATGFNGGMTANLDGPISLGATIGIVDIDNVRKNMTTFDAKLAYDFPVEGFGACAVAGLGYATWGDEFGGTEVDLSAISLPLGIAVGAVVGERDSAFLIPSGEAGLLYQRVRGSLSDGSDSVTGTETDTNFYVTGGATLPNGPRARRRGARR